MPVQVLEESYEKVTVVFEGFPRVYVNSIRRASMSLVPVMAIDDVVILENTSSFYDEVIAHRLGLIPLKTPLEKYLIPSECDCKSALGCPKCRVLFVLDAEATDKVRDVLSAELVSEDEEVKPVSPNIPIIKLAPGQKIKLEAYAKLGRGKSHSKWQATSAAVLRSYPLVALNESCNNCGMCVSACTKDVFSIRNGKLKVDNPLNCNLCFECLESCQAEPKGINVKEDEDKFILTIESSGGMAAREILVQAVKEVIKLVDDVIDKFSGEVLPVEKEK
ncbi:MAG: DNA-directed RNA polymerase subunit D [Nitrososphaeria archaeon]